ncbi:MAG: DNA mismatch repair protein MutS [Deltaproteobacteria bacterium]|nr:DNA mismatch repair protein MutS [Deltaproteobacteria bacterium]
MEKVTPAMRQYLEIKAKNKDAIVFFRMGDFYEMFFEDAKLAAAILGIALTSRDRQRKIPMCGVPYHAASQYVARLVKDGYRVAICEQMEDPEDADGVVDRAVVRIITPGVALEDELLDAKTNNYVAAVSFGAGGKTARLYGLSFMDATTGEFRVAEFTSLAALKDEIRRIAPAELLLPEGESLNGRGAPAASETELQVKNTRYLSGFELRYDSSLELMLSHFNTLSLDGFGLSGFSEGIKAAGALLSYVKGTRKADLGHVRKCVPHYPDDFLVMDHTTRRNLELLENARTLTKEGSLFDLLDRTRTPMGGRQLRQWLLYPLRDVSGIEDRLAGVADLLEDRLMRGEVEKELAGIYDLERLAGKVAVGIAGPRDLISLKESLKKVGMVKSILGAILGGIPKGFKSPVLSRISSSLDCVSEVIGLIEESINDTPPLKVMDGGYIKKGYSKELDELRDIGRHGKDWIAGLEASERQRTGISTLKVSYNRVFGYYIECTKANLKNVPPDYTRKQTLVGAERFVTPELKEWESRILSAEDTAKALEAALVEGIMKDTARHVERIQSSAALVAALDVLASFADVAEDMNYVRPEVRDGEAIIIEDGRHPVIEKDFPGGGFVPNDLRLDRGEDQIIILTGPNMAGKSTYIRQAGLTVVMAQAGSFVPAKKAIIGVVDRVFTRVGASDDIARGQSTFMVEMNETANILNNATPRSLIILDEIGRGTSTFDGLSIAWAVAEYIHDSPALGARTLFATHYHELTDLSLTKERVKNYNMVVKESGGKVIFLRKVLPGGASRSYGIQVARLAGLPMPVIERASEVLGNLEKGELNEAGLPRIAGRHGRMNPGQMNPGLKNSADTGGAASGRLDVLDKGQPGLPCLFGPSAGPAGQHSVLDGRIRKLLTELDVNGITPVEALNILNKLKGMLDE